MPSFTMRAISLFLALVFLVRCSSSATLVLQDRSEVSGKILGSDSESVHIETKDGRKRIANSQIADIDHPGKPSMLIGVALLAMGLTLLFGTEQRDCKDNCGFLGSYDPIAFTTSLVGAGFFLSGVYFYRGSSKALSSPVTPEMKQISFGLEYQYRF